MTNHIDPWGREYTDAEQRGKDARDAGYNGWLDRDGDAIMSRTDPKDGQALGFESRGWSGKGSPDEKRARGLRRR